MLVMDIRNADKKKEEEKKDIFGLDARQNVSIADAAEVLGKSQQFVRIALQQGILPIGIALKMSSQYTYHISPKKLREYVGSGGEFAE